MKRFTALLLIPAFFIVVTSCSKKSASDTKSEAAKYNNFLSSFVDSTVNPADDFFRYAMGQWVKNNPIPASENSWGVWSLVDEENYDRLKKINDDAAAKKDAKPGSADQKIGDFWFTGMDTVSIEKMGITPLQPELAKIDAITDKKSMLAEAAELQTLGVGVFYGNYIEQDEMISSKYRIHLYQGGIGLPDRDYYFDTDARTKNIRDEYVKHIAKMFELSGTDAATAEKNAATIMRMETDLAKASRKLEDLRDPYANYNKMTVSAIDKTTPSIEWGEFFTMTGAKDIDTVIVGQPEFFIQLEKNLKQESVDNWKIYLKWNLIDTYASKLSSDFDKENFHFYGTIMNGATEQRARWKRVLDEEEGDMGFLLGQLYVKQYFSPETKQRYEKVVDNIIDAYKDRIQNLPWMSDSTKQLALKKLSSVIKKVGYPDTWRDYSNLEIDRESYAKNCMHAAKYRNDYKISKLYKPVDRTEWDMTPQTYNAYYEPSNNEIVVPAAMFIIPGLPDQYADDALVYSYAGGSTIGHEITHGFDDQGRQFDENGNLKNWWTKKDEVEFLQRSKMIVRQFDSYTVVDSLHANGDATQGENIADLGGVLLGLDAFKKTDEYKQGKSIGGFTPVQRYFIGYALSWLGSIRPETLSLMVKTDVHAPNYLRVNGPLSNVPDFYQAFNVKPGDPMYREDSARVKIW